MTYSSAYPPLSAKHEEIATQIVDALYQVHKQFGPGLLEKPYELCVCYDLSKRGLQVDRQVPVPIKYHGIVIDEGFRADILVENLVLVELKAVTEIHPVHKAQILSHMQLLDIRLGFLVNFHVNRIKDGIWRLVR